MLERWYLHCASESRRPRRREMKFWVKVTRPATPAPMSKPIVMSIWPGAGYLKIFEEDRRVLEVILRRQENLIPRMRNLKQGMVFK